MKQKEKITHCLLRSKLKITKIEDYGTRLQKLKRTVRNFFVLFHMSTFAQD